MKIEKFIRVNEWLNVREEPGENDSLYDFSEYFEGIHHTLSEAHELYQQYCEYMKNVMST